MSAKTAKMPAPPTTDSDVASLQVSLPQMLDLALGTPEVGAVNLNILHNFLHVLLHEVDLKSTKVEYRGEDANRVKTMVASLKTGPTLHLHEYSITDDSGNVKHRIPSTETPTANVDVLANKADEKPVKSMKPTASVPVTAREKSEKEKDLEVFPEETAEDTERLRKTKGLRQQVGPGTNSEYQTVIFVEPILDGVPPTALGFKQLEQSVNQLQQRFQALEELSTNPELVERLKGKMTDPLTDMWQIINITKRLDASEKGIDKLTTMVQDVIKGDASITVTEDTSRFDERIKNLENNINNIEQTIHNLQVIGTVSGDGNVQAPEASPETGVPVATNVEDTDNVDPEGSVQTEGTTDPVSKNPTNQTPQRMSLSQLLGGVNIAEMHADVSALKTEVSQMRKDMYDINEKMSRIPAETRVPVMETHVDATPAADVETVKDEGERKEPIGLQTVQPDDTSLSRCMETIETVQRTYGDAVQRIDDRLEKLEKEVTSLSERVNAAPAAGVTDDSEINELVTKIQGIQSDVERINETADRLIDDRENRDVHLNALLEQIELLKTIKADKEDLEDALADKADAQVLNRKVSHDQFDTACDDLARGLQDAVSKLGKQESIWQEALDEVQKEIESKVDQIEITPLRDFVNDQLRSLQKKLKSIAELRHQNEAAGSKKLLRDVQCISCDKNVVMKTEEVNKFRADPLPCTVSMKPYLTYELDQVRKQQRRLPHSRNMLQFEAALQEEAERQKSARSGALAKTPRDHLCNRYCGGSHTVTTPQQRVMRKGHFLTQWEPKTVQLTDGVVKGTDGKVYRSRPMPGKLDVCGPSCEDRTDEELQPSDRRTNNATASKKPGENRKMSAGSRKRSARKYSAELPIKETNNGKVDPQNEVSVETKPYADQIILYEMNN